MEKRKPGPDVKFDDDDHKRQREATRRYYWRKKEERVGPRHWVRHYVMGPGPDENEMEQVTLLKTRDHDEAFTQAHFTYNLWKLKNPDEEDPDVSGIDISIQPYCFKCKRDLRFSARYCDLCGDEREWDPGYMMSEILKILEERSGVE